MPLSFSQRFQRALSGCAIPGLIRYVVLFNALVFGLHILVPGFISVLTLDPSLVLQGQIWRLVTWIFIPETFSPFWIVFALLFLFFIGDGLEAAIGSAKLTRFYLCGILLCTIVAFGFWLMGSSINFTGANIFLNLTLLLGFATICPEVEIMVMFVIPMRISWLALISALLMIFSSLGQPPVVIATLAVSFLNFFLFFQGELRSYIKSLNLGGSRNSTPIFRRNAGKSGEEVAETLHCCETCGRTEISHPDLDFRVTRSGSEYCREHLPK